MGLKGEIEQNATLYMKDELQQAEVVDLELTKKYGVKEEQMVSLVSKDFVLGLLSRLQQQIQNEMERIKLEAKKNPSVIEQACFMGCYHKLEWVLAFLDGVEPHKAEGETK